MPAKKSASREPVPIKFPPSKALERKFARVLKLAMRFPEVEESRSYGTPAIKVKGKLLARLRSEAEGGLAIWCDLEDREMLLATDPDAFYITDHYADHPMVLVNLSRVSWKKMPDLVEYAWRHAAPARLQKRLDAE